jgi:hypothetical protein
MWVVIKDHWILPFKIWKRQSFENLACNLQPDEHNHAFLTAFCLEKLQSMTSSSFLSTDICRFTIALHSDFGINVNQCMEW